MTPVAANAESGQVEGDETPQPLLSGPTYFDYPDASRDLNRWLPLVKWLLAIPRYVVLFFLHIGALLSR